MASITKAKWADSLRQFRARHDFADSDSLRMLTLGAIRSAARDSNLDEIRACLDALDEVLAEGR